MTPKNSAGIKGAVHAVQDHFADLAMDNFWEDSRTETVNSPISSTSAQENDAHSRDTPSTDPQVFLLIDSNNGFNEIKRKGML